MVSINHTINLYIDLGNSETRCFYKTSFTKGYFTLSNHFAEIEDGIPEDYLNSASTCFVVDNKVIGYGDIVENEYSRTYIAPNVLRDKHTQVTTKYSIVLSCIKALEKVANTVGITTPSDANWTFNISVLLPPQEQSGYKNEMTDIVKSIRGIEVVVPTKYNIPVTISSVFVAPEAIVAFTSAIFHESVADGTLRMYKDCEKFLRGYVLVIDIGAGTTDLVLVKDGKFIFKSRNTIKIGGKLVEDLCKSYIKRDFKYTPTDITSVIKEGVLVKGNNEYNVSRLLNSAKKEFVARLREEIRSYFVTLEVPMEEVKGLLTVGGGTLAAVHDGVTVSNATSDFILEMFREVTPDIEPVPLHNVNPREANVVGLYLMAKFNSK